MTTKANPNPGIETYSENFNWSRPTIKCKISRFHFFDIFLTDQSSDSDKNKIGLEFWFWDVWSRDVSDAIIQSCANRGIKANSYITGDREFQVRFERIIIDISDISNIEKVRHKTASESIAAGISSASEISTGSQDYFGIISEFCDGFGFGPDKPLLDTCKGIMEAAGLLDHAEELFDLIIQSLSNFQIFLQEQAAKRAAPLRM